MDKLYTFPMNHGKETWMCFFCPGCEREHVLDPSIHSWNGIKESPTIWPSVLFTGTSDGRLPRCHSFIESGKIRFLADCTHSMAGQTVELPEAKPSIMST